MALSDRSKRQSFLGADSDGVFKESIVGIVGLCGGGSHIAQQLAHVGVGRFRLFDHDHVDDSNLNRMIGSTPADAENKRLKTDVILEMILRIQPAAAIEYFSQKWQEQHAKIRECTAVFGCVDSFLERERLEAYCRRYLIPYFDVGMDIHEIRPGQYSISGQAIASIPDCSCMRCMGFITEKRLAEEAQRYGNAGDRPQVVWPNGVLASTVVGMFVGVVTPWRNPQEFVPFVEYDGNRHLLRPSNVLGMLRDRQCPHFAGENNVGDALWRNCLH